MNQNNFGMTCLLGCIALAFIVETNAETASVKPPGHAEFRIRSFLPEKPISRAQRPAVISAVIENAGTNAIKVTAQLVLPPGVRSIGRRACTSLWIGRAGEKQLS